MCVAKGVTYVPCIDASLIYIIFLLVTGFGCFNHIWMGDLNFGKDLSSGGSFIGLCALQPYWLSGSELGKLLGLYIMALCSFLVCNETLTASMLPGSLMAGRVVLSCLLCGDTAGLSLSEKETDISGLILFGFIYPCLVDFWVSSAGLEHWAPSADPAAPCLLIESTSI